LGLNPDGFVKGPSAALLLPFVVSACLKVRLTPQALNALPRNHLSAAFYEIINFGWALRNGCFLGVLEKRASYGIGLTFLKMINSIQENITPWVGKGGCS
jgi:hypothetical protein